MRVQAKQASTLKQHKADKHDLGVVWYTCDADPGKCEYRPSRRAPSSGTRRTSTASAWSGTRATPTRASASTGPSRRATSSSTRRTSTTSASRGTRATSASTGPSEASHLKQHKADTHDLGVTWHACDADPGKCDFQAKQASNLYDHIRTQHARVYAQRRKEQEERVRRALVDAGWQEHRLAEAMPPVGHFRREKRIDFKCAKLETHDTWCRIDFVLGVPNGFVFLEVDEHQHKYGYGDHLSCDMKRMACVMESLAVETNYNVPNLYWLRYNPNAWHVGGETRRMPKADREANLVAWLERFECVAPFGIGYAFYDCEAPEEEGVEDEEDEPGALDVLGNGEYNPQYAEVAQNLMDLARVCGD